MVQSSAAKNVTERLTDSKKYTGTNKARFDAEGKGKGKAGREDVVKVDGSTSSAARDHAVAATVSGAAKSKPVVKPAAEGDKVGEVARKVVLFQYADKAHAGQKVVLTKQKFPTMKQLADLTSKMIPVGKAKVILDSEFKEVKDLADLVNGGNYLVITGYDKAKLNQSKVPTAFTGEKEKSTRASP